MKKYYRTYTVIDENIVRDNLLSMKKLIEPGVKILAVIKADAYGHGAVRIAECINDDCDYFGVATVDEAIELRNAGIVKGILILGYSAHEEYFDIIEHDITPVIYRYEDAYILNTLAARRNKRVKIHLAVDTGMGRIGFRNREDEIKDADRIFELSNLMVEGIFSHFSCADDKEKTKTEQQAESFEDFLENMKNSGGIAIRHISNSAGIINYNYHYDMVRDGISLYGYYPSEFTDKTKLAICPALEWHAHITNIKTVERGDTISYGATFTADKKMKVATVSVGYADGYSRKMSNKGKVLIGGAFAPVIGRVCMDQIMVDVTGIDGIKIEDDVVLMGRQGENVITADDIAGWTETISYEVLCDVGRRVVRTYKDDWL